MPNLDFDQSNDPTTKGGINNQLQNYRIQPLSAAAITDVSNARDNNFSRPASETISPNFSPNPSSSPLGEEGILQFSGSQSHSNTLNNFISSFQRAQSFVGGSANELTNEGMEEEAIIDDDSTETTGLLRQHTNKSRRSSMFSNFSIITGNSTLVQTVFNSINVLVGIAILSIPYAMKLSGIVLGTVMIVGCYILTMTTAKILGRILSKKPHLFTYGDIGGYAFGPKFELLITILFCVDMTGALLSLTLLFSSSFSSLVSVSEPVLKLLIFVVMFFLTFLPLNYLSVISLMGIVTVFSMVIMIIMCGFVTTVSPGSLINPMPINLWPHGDTWLKDILLSLGMFMAPWGGHPVFPELYRDMKHNHKYSKGCTVSFSFTFLLDYMIGLFAILMYGEECQDFLMKNLIENTNYPSFFRSIFLIIMGIIPISKMPLIAKPLISTYENYFGVNDVKIHTNTTLAKKVGMRVLYVSVTLMISLLVTSFGKVVAFVGSSVCFLLCIVLPFWFKLKILRSEISHREAAWLKVGIVVGIILAIAGTFGVVMS